MRKLYKNQKRMIKEYAQKQYSINNTHMFIQADTLSIYNDLCDINIYECMDSDIERFYSDVIADIKKSI